MQSREDEGAWLYLGMTATLRQWKIQRRELHFKERSLAKREVAFGVDKQGRPIHLQKSGVASQRFARMYSIAGPNVPGSSRKYITLVLTKRVGVVPFGSLWRAN